MIVGGDTREEALVRALEGEEIEVSRPPGRLSAPNGNEIEQVAASMVAFEELLTGAPPDAVVLASASNVALGAVLVATRLLIPVASLEDDAHRESDDPMSEMNGRLIRQLADVSLSGDAGTVAAWLRARVTA